LENADLAFGCPNAEKKKDPDSGPGPSTIRIGPVASGRKTIFKESLANEHYERRQKVVRSIQG